MILHGRTTMIEVKVTPIHGTGGPVSSLARAEKALDYFKYLLLADSITTIVNNTNNNMTETILDFEDERKLVA